MAPVDTAILSPEDRRKIIDALEDKRYIWRTMDGVAKDTGLPLELVESAILRDDQLNTLAASFPDKQGRALFTTRQHYQKKRSLGWRIVGAIAGKAI